MANAASPTRKRRSFPVDRPKPLKWWTYTQKQRDAIIHEFWTVYFKEYPEDGTNLEINILRRQYEHTPGPDYDEFKRNWTLLQRS